MKNIHVLPTEKPSRLSDCHDNKLYLDDVRYLRNYKNIYITSNEEIKEGDYFMGFAVTNKKPYISCASEYKARKKEKGKIILTTDQDLIKDGIQAIDDDFLEWFVSKANDSGKPIDIVGVEEVYFNGSGYYDANQLSEQEKELYSSMKEYKIIIPKQIDVLELGQIIPKEEPKQETLEKSAELALLFHNTYERLAPSFGYETRQDTKEFDFKSNNGRLMLAVCSEVIKWQQEQDKNKYSEEDLAEAFEAGKRLGEDNACMAENYRREDFKEWFEQFKNKSK